MISEKKNTPQNDFWGKNSYKEIPGEKNPTLKKKMSFIWSIMLEKILHRCMSGKNCITRPRFLKGRLSLIQD